MPGPPPPGVEVRRAAERDHTEAAGRRTAHSFSFGAHYDAANVAFGPLVAHNDEWLEAGAGYADHPHADVEIVSWIVQGALHHVDDRGHDTVVPAGCVQVLSAGSGVVHREVAGGRRTRFVQAWLRPDDQGAVPTYASQEVAPLPGGWAALAGGEGLPLRVAGAQLLLGTPGAAPLAVPVAPRRHLFVLAGTIEVAGLLLEDGDALRVPPADGVGPLMIAARSTDAQVLAWLLP